MTTKSHFQPVDSSESEAHLAVDIDELRHEVQVKYAAPSRSLLSDDSVVGVTVWGQTKQGVDDASNCRNLAASTRLADRSA